MKDPFARFTDYDFRHWVGVQATDGDILSVHRLFGLQPRSGPNCWFTARDARNDVAGYVADLDIARAAADRTATSAPSAELIALQCRYALIAGSIREVAGRHLPPLVTHYVRSGLWSRAQALAWARLSPDPARGLATVREALREAPDTGQSELARLALSTGAAIADADNRVLAVADLADDLPPHVLRDALAIVASEPNQGSRLGGLRRILLKLPLPLRREALAVANAFTDRLLRAQAIVTVAERLDEPERSAEIDAVLASIRDGPPPCSDSTAWGGVARALPLERVREFLQVVRRGGKDTQWSVVAECLNRLGDVDPDWVLEQLADCPGWVLNQVLDSVAVGLARRGRHRDAVTALKRMSASVLGMNAGAVASLLFLAPPDEREPLLDLFRQLSGPAQVRVLEALVAESASSELLRLLVGIAHDGDEIRVARSTIAPVLTAPEVDCLLTEALDSQEPSKTAAVVSKLTPYLAAGQVRRALDVLESSPSSPPWDVYKALIVQLAVLGDHDKALQRVREIARILEFERADILAVLAPHLPDELLPTVRQSVRPAGLAVERGLARSTLVPWLPAATVDEIVADALGLGEPRDRLRVLAELVQHVGPDRLVVLGEAAAASVRENMESTHVDRYVLESGFHTIGRVLGRVASVELEERALALARSASLSTAGQILMLVQIATAGGERSHVRRALSVAFDLAGDDAARLATIAGALSAAHAPALTAVLERQDDARLVPFLAAAAPFLDDAGRAETQRRVGAIDDALSRLAALALVLPHLPQPLQREVVSAELHRSSQWAHPESTFLFALSVLVPYAPDGITPYASLLPDAFARVTPQLMVSYAGSLAGGTPFEADIAGMAFDTLESLPPAQRGNAIAELAPLLDSAQIERALGYLAGRVSRETKAVAALLERAIGLDDARLIDAVLQSVEVEPERAELVVRVADRLPPRALPLALEHAEHGDSALGAVAVRAATLGETGQMLSALARVNWANSADAIARVYRVAPETSFDALIACAQKQRPSDQARAWSELIPRLAPERRTGLVEKVVRASSSLRLGQSLSRLRILQRLEPELSMAPTSTLVTLWTEALGSGVDWAREETLVDIRGFVRPLVAHFGPAVAAELDQAILVAGRDRWP